MANELLNHSNVFLTSIARDMIDELVQQAGGDVKITSLYDDKVHVILNQTKVTNWISMF